MLMLGVLHSTKTYRRHKITVGVRFDGSCIGGYCAIEAPIGRRDLNEPSVTVHQIENK
jgi:hypothetical protein